MATRRRCTRGFSRSGTLSAMTDRFWSDRRTLVTGGSGFLGTAVLAALQRHGASAVVAPTSADYDLRDPLATERMIADHSPDVIIHLAARVGGIGANMVRPADLYLDNLLMGTYVLEAAPASRGRQDGDDRHHLLVSQGDPRAVRGGLPLAGLPRGDQRPLRDRQAGSIGAAPGQPRPSTGRAPSISCRPTSTARATSSTPT